MKNTITTALIAIIGVMTFTGCSKNEPTTPTNPTNNSSTWPYKMTATINGASFSRDTCECTFYWNDTTNITILGWAGDPKTGPNYYPQVYLYISEYHGTGTYVFSNPGKNSAKLLTEPTGGGGISTVGSVTITSIYPSVVGTFSFTLPSGIVVSNGNFIAKRY